MVDAPEKIWAHYSPDFGIVSAYDVEMPSNLLTWHTEYTRSDIAAELAAENERQSSDIAEFMRRLGPRWFLEQGWFPKSVGAREDDARRTLEGGE